MKQLPFKQQIKSGILIREFSKDVDSSELAWHRDKKDRLVTVREGTGWMLQIENRLPESLSEGSIYFIPKNTYHRVIRGSTGLIIEIDESPNILRQHIRGLI